MTVGSLWNLPVPYSEVTSQQVDIQRSFPSVGMRRAPQSQELNGDNHAYKNTSTNPNLIPTFALQLPNPGRAE